MPSSELKSRIVETVKKSGFDLCGITAVQEEPDYHAYEQWLKNNRNAGMSYLAEHSDLRRFPRKLLPEARSAIVVALNYFHENHRDISPVDAMISLYARGQDYHEIIRRRLKTAADILQDLSEEKIIYRICVDTAPVLERSHARRAGLGWIGKNTCLIHPILGSYLFLGILLINKKLTPDKEMKDQCGNCRRCLDYCPTGALVAPRILDARRCLSYLTIENRNTIPEQFHNPLKNMFFGCDICQNVCPFNHNVPEGDEIFKSRNKFSDLSKVISLSEKEFACLFKDSPLKRAKHSGLIRNLLITLKEVNHPELKKYLALYSNHPSNTVKQTVAQLKKR